MWFYEIAKILIGSAACSRNLLDLYGTGMICMEARKNVWKQHDLYRRGWIYIEAAGFELKRQDLHESDKMLMESAKI